jgi:hypothetical protein
VESQVTSPENPLVSEGDSFHNVLLRQVVRVDLLVAGSLNLPQHSQRKPMLESEEEEAV